MDKHEKLVELLKVAYKKVEHQCGAQTWRDFADALIDHGVAVQGHGRWIYKPYENDEAVWLYHCSECNTVSATVKNYCPVCGAKMTEVING